MYRLGCLSESLKKVRLVRNFELRIFSVSGYVGQGRFKMIDIKIATDPLVFDQL